MKYAFNFCSERDPVAKASQQEPLAEEPQETDQT